MKDGLVGRPEAISQVGLCSKTRQCSRGLDLKSGNRHGEDKGHSHQAVNLDCVPPSSPHLCPGGLCLESCAPNMRPWALSQR